MSLLGIDLGTTGCKAAAYSEAGESLASAYREYPMLRPAPGQVELDSHGVLRLVREIIREIAAQVRHDPITALSLSSMGEALVPFSEDRGVLANSIVASVDVRGGDLLDRVVEKVGAERFYSINPNLPAPTYSLPKLLWIRENQPDLYEETRYFLPWGDAVAFHLGCRPCTSFSQANRTLLFDIRSETWSRELLDASGIDPSKLPEPVMSGTVAGHVSDEIAAEIGLPKGVAVVVGAHDQCCNALGAGVCEAGRAVCGIGTFECITPVYDAIPDLAAMRRIGLNVEHHAAKGLYVSFIYNQSGSLVRWFRDTFAQKDMKDLGPETDIYELLTREIPEEPTRLLALPYFEPTGAPEFVSDLAGTIAGLHAGVRRGDILKCLMEGATFYFVRSLTLLKNLNIAAEEFIATGGGAKSDAWLQIKADIMGVPFVRLSITECGTVGAAILAGLATGVYANASEAAARFVRRERVFEPEPRRHEIYREQYGRYQKLREAVLPILKAGS